MAKVKPRICSRSMSLERRAKIEENIQQVNLLSDACFTTLKCEMCGEKLQDWMDAEHIAEMAFTRGWRFQNDQALCQFCTDDKR